MTTNKAGTNATAGKAGTNATSGKAGTNVTASNAGTDVGGSTNNPLMKQPQIAKKQARTNVLLRGKKRRPSRDGD
jgi:hypothetical protein